jgi:hypothetical protein
MIVLEVAIGIVFLYLLLSLIVTTIQEGIASLLQLRAKNLFASINDMLVDPQRTKKLFEHPLIRNLASQRLAVENDNGKLKTFTKGLPSYIPSRTFALALLDVLRAEAKLTEATGASQLLAEADQLVGKIKKGRVQTSLRLLVADASQLGKDVDERAELVSRRIETWFNERMARTSGWYKRKAQFLSLAIAAVVTLLSNADTLYVVQRLWGDGALRASVVAAAQAYESSQPASSDTKLEERLKGQIEQVASSGLPVGWSWREGSLCARSAAPGAERCWSPTAFDRAFLFLGWIVTALALSLGAAFWFDVLNKALQLRGSGPKISAATGRVESERS